MTSALLQEFGPPYKWLPLLYPWRILPPLLGLAWVAVIVVRIFT
jgi:hypothetical protein